MKLGNVLTVCRFTYIHATESSPQTGAASCNKQTMTPTFHKFKNCLRHWIFQARGWPIHPFRTEIPYISFKC